MILREEICNGGDTWRADDNWASRAFQSSADVADADPADAADGCFNEPDSHLHQEQLKAWPGPLPEKLLLSIDPNMVSLHWFPTEYFLATSWTVICSRCLGVKMDIGG